MGTSYTLCLYTSVITSHMLTIIEHTIWRIHIINSVNTGIIKLIIDCIILDKCSIKNIYNFEFGQYFNFQCLKKTIMTISSQIDLFFQYINVTDIKYNLLRKT